jgi:hypothetical protein
MDHKTYFVTAILLIFVFSPQTIEAHYEVFVIALFGMLFGADLKHLILRR